MNFFPVRLINLIKHEIALYRKLSIRTRAFLISILTYDVTDTVLFVFMYAFVFRQSQSMLAPAAFNLTFYFTMVLGQLFNLKLLKVLSGKQVFILSGIGQAVVIASMFFLHLPQLWQIALLGGVYGLPLGMYWGVRNSVYLGFSTDDNRHYFEGLRKLFGNTANAILPLMAGWLIAYTSQLNNFRMEWSYQLIGLGSLMLVILGMFKLNKINFPKIRFSQLKIGKISQHWTLFRSYVITSSFQFGLVLALPDVLVLRYLGNEGVLGSFQTIFVLLGAACLYVLGKKTHAGSRYALLKASAWPLIAVSLLLFLHLSPLTIVIYLLVMRVSDQLFWFVYFPLFSKAVEHESQTQNQGEYGYVLDHEIFINLGRTFATILFILISQNWNPEFGIRVMVVLGALTQVVSLQISRKLFAIHQHQHQTV